MNLSDVIVAWVMIGFLAVITRPQMVWKEESRAYRFMLLVICTPAQLFVSFIGLFVAMCVTSWKFMVNTYNGVDPTGHEHK